MKIPIQLPNPPEGYKAEAFIVANRKAKRGVRSFLNVWDAVYTDENSEDLHRPILQLQKIEPPAPKIKATEIAALKTEVARLSRAFAASNETNANLQEDLEFYRDLLCVCKTCQSSPCTGGCIVIRKAKIEVLKEVRELHVAGLGCEYTAGLDIAIDDVQAKIKQLEAER